MGTNRSAPSPRSWPPSRALADLGVGEDDALASAHVRHGPGGVVRSGVRVGILPGLGARAIGVAAAAAAGFAVVTAEGAAKVVIEVPPKTPLVASKPRMVTR